MSKWSDEAIRESEKQAAYNAGKAETRRQLEEFFEFWSMEVGPAERSLLDSISPRNATDNGHGG